MATLEGACLLKISNTEGLNKFLHNCVDDLIGRKQDNFDNYTSDVECTKAELIKARNLIQSVYKQGVLSDDFIPKFGDLNVNDVNLIKECFTLRKEEIYQAVVKEKLLKAGHPLVENIDWKLKWVIGSSKLASISEPLLEVDFHCLNHGSANSRSTVNFEMNLVQLDKFIEELEMAKKNLL